MHLRPMYMPRKNYRDLDEFLLNYWLRGKDIIGVTHFGDLVPEVPWLGEEYEAKVRRLTALRIEKKRKSRRIGNGAGRLTAEIAGLKSALKIEMEAEITRRLLVPRLVLADPRSNHHLSLAAVFEGDFKPTD